MKTNEKKVVFLEQVQSPYIEQAILVLRKTQANPPEQSGIIAEAERIVTKYAEEHFASPTFTMEPPTRRQKAKQFLRKNVLWLSLTVSCLLAAVGISLYVGLIIW